MARALVAALALALLAPAAASAATAYMDGGVMRVTGTDQREVLEVRYIDDGPSIAVSVLFSSVAAGAGCTASSNGSAVCPYNGTSSIQVDLGAGDDELYADPGVPLRATGGPGDDRMYIRSGLSPWETAPVVLDGGDGDDHLGGGRGDDVMVGGAGDDGIDGADGNDRVDPGPGEDSVTDSSGDDTIYARDGDADQVDCGGGSDTGDFDAIDRVSNCELGNLPPPRPPDCTPQLDPVRDVSYATLRRTRALTVAVTADTGCTVRARIALSSGSVVAVATASAHRGAARIRLSEKALRSLRRHRRFKVSITSSAQGAATVRRSFRVRLR